MGFNTATETALLATTAVLATQHLPAYAIICLPILFTAGMSLMDTLDGFWNSVAAFNINSAGFLIVGMSIITWIAALAFWKFAALMKNRAPS
jgi:high-affinity nickel permease